MKDIVKSRTNAEVKIINGKRVKLHRRSRRSKVTTYTAVAVAVFTTIGLILSLCFFFNLEKVSVSGVTLYTGDQIVEVGGVVNGANLFRTNTKLIEERLVDTLPYIESAKVTKDFPNSLVIEVVEAEKAVEIESDNAYYVISRSGRVLEGPNQIHDTSLPLVKGFEIKSPKVNEKLESRDSHKTKILMQIVEDIKESEIDNITVIDLTDRTDIVMWYDNRIEMRVGSSLDMDYKLTYMKYVVRDLADDYEGMLRYNGMDTGITEIKKGAQTTRPVQTPASTEAPADAVPEETTEPGTDQAPAAREYTGWEEE